MSIRTNARILGAIEAGETRRSRMWRAVTAQAPGEYRNITVGLRPHDYDRFDAIAKARDLPTAHLARMILKDYLNQ